MHRVLARVLAAATAVSLAALPCRAELYSADMPQLVGGYGGIGGVGRTGSFDFEQSFTHVGAVWLQLTGKADVTTGYPVDTGFQGKLEGVWGPVHVIEQATTYTTSVPLAVSDALLDGAGVVTLYIDVDACCDHASYVFEASLWICTGDPELSIEFTSKDELTWSAPPGASAFDVVRGDLAALLGSGGDYAVAVAECLEDDWSAPPLIHGEDPLPGEGFWYLVRRVTGSGNGSYDTCSPAQLGGRDAEIEQSGLGCL
jgi:hypothetical protein